MSVYFRKMHEGKWRTIELSDQDVETATIDYVKTQLRCMERCILNVNQLCDKSDKLKSLELSSDMKNHMALALMDKWLSPFHYFLDNRVEENLVKKDDL